MANNSGVAFSFLFSIYYRLLVYLTCSGDIKKALKLPIDEMVMSEFFRRPPIWNLKNVNQLIKMRTLGTL